MAHNINSMAYYGERPWHGMGSEIPERATAEEMITASGLNWKVEARPARGARKDRKGRYSRYEIVRLPRDEANESETLLGAVSKYYTPLQNADAFAFFDPVVGESMACFETAGALGEGECIWTLAKLPEVMEIVPGDICMRYLLLSNRHDGKGSVTVKFTAIRVVCQNTLMLAHQDGQAAYRVRHSKAMPERLAEIGNIMRTAHQLYEQCGKVFKQMAHTALHRNRLDTFLEAVYPRSEAQKKTGTRPEKWRHIDRLLEEAPDLQGNSVRGTVWAAYNAITHYEDYRPSRTPEDGSVRLNRVWFGSSATVKLNALNSALKLIA
ncbi:DUF932 domain-containing protein [Noviherbaspirillum sp. ST9]|uniref:DUF932 domain-containing protein n=1 Tax=Noviherbaspirillum sp. ST9 TaxID=3401606 RepID=UPI003B5873B6